MKWLVFVLVASCATPAILVDGQDPHHCLSTEAVCVDGNLKPTGTCCPGGWACGGPFPNVGCPDGMCCPAEGSLSEYLKPTAQRSVK